MKRIVLSLICIMGLFVSSISVNAQELSLISEETQEIMASSSTTYTYSIGGVNGDGDDFTPNVNYSATIFGLMGSVGSAYKSTTPSYSYISGNNPGGYKRLGSKIVLLTGHANANIIQLDNNNGNTKIGVHDTNSYTATSGRKYYGLNNVSMSNTDLIMFFGCNTASGTSNLCTKSVSKGASASVGTTQEVVSRTGEGATWVQRFIDGLYNGKTVAQAGAYANNFVSSTCSMRTGWTCIGTSSTVVNPSGSKSLVMNEVENSDIQGQLDPDIIENKVNINFELNNRNIISENAAKYEKELYEVIEYIKTIDDTFDLSDYKLSIKSLDDNVSIVSLDYYIGDTISTNKGFNFICENGVINTLSYNGKYYLNQKDDFDEYEIEKKVNEDMENNREDINSVSKDQKGVFYYTYDFSTGNILFIEEKYSFDGEVWKESYSERVIK